MCGICGFYGPEDRKLLKSMADILHHRGPDDDGFFSDSRCSLGMRRLAIIDVAHGHQPQFNEDGTVAIVFNGEIYNYKELRSKLPGHRFRTDSDTEAIVHCYEEFGFDCVSHLNGMFAFAIYDSRKRLLFIARDRFGEKPLYYTFVGRSLYFASEIKSLLLVPGMRRQLNPDALGRYLSFRANTSSETFFRGVFKLPPAHFMAYDGKQLKVEKYWSRSHIMPDYSKDEAYLTRRFYQLLKGSVEARMMSEVPLGAYLSAGIDSASVVAFMSKAGNEPVKTFSAGFSEDSSELKGARLIASHFGTEHREVMIRHDSVELLPDVVWHLDEPLADPTCIPIYMLSEKVRPYVTVILTGDGSDELLYGYEQVKLMSLHHRLVRRMPLGMRSMLLFVARAFPKSVYNLVFRYAGSLGEKGFERFSRFVKSRDPVQMYLYLVSVFSEEEKDSVLLGRGKEESSALMSELRSLYFRGSVSGNGSHGSHDGHDSHDGLLIRTVLMDEAQMLADDMLMRSDKNTMAHSVEQRVPFLDHGLAEFLQSVPPKYKLHGLRDKYLLRKSMAHVLPRDSAFRKKARFFTPIHEWFEHELRDVSRQLLSREGCRAVGISHDYVEKAFSGLGRSKLYYGRQLWALLVYRVWHKLFIEDGLSSKPKVRLGDLV